MLTPFSMGVIRPRLKFWRTTGAAVAIFLFLAGTLSLAKDESPQGYTLGQPGYIVIEAARDSAGEFQWEAAGVPGRRTLVWDQGTLTLPDTIIAENFARSDLGVNCTADLAGNGASGQLILRDGIYPVSEPIVISDGRLELRVSAGELEIRGTRIRYRRTVETSREFTAGLLLLAGMTLIVIVLLRRARLKSDERTGT